MCLIASLKSYLCFQVVKTGGTPKVPDCFQRTPKKLCIPEKTEILAVNVDSKGKQDLACKILCWILYYLSLLVENNYCQT